MTEEKCYSLEKDGTYCLGFPNRYAIPEKEIEKIFSEYGSVLSVRTSGDERGFRFVRFKLLEEAERAIEGLKGNKKIRILPKKPKVQTSNEKSSQRDTQKSGQHKNLGSKKKDNQNKKKDDDDFNESFKTDEPSNNSFKDSTNDTGFEETVYNIEKENLMKFLRLRSLRGATASSFNSVSTSNSTENDDSNHPALKKNDNKSRQNNNKRNNPIDDINDPFKCDKLKVSKSQQHSKNKKAVNCSDMSDFCNKGTNEEDEMLVQKIRRGMRFHGNHSPSELGDESTSTVDYDSVMKLRNNDEPPELISTDELKQRSVKGSVCGDEPIKIVMAEEVIVANVHENFSVLYILYLLEKFDPICVTEMKTISKNGVRYCSVYFKSQKDAIAVEKKFDNFDLSGNKLIVRTPELLINEVAAA